MLPSWGVSRFGFRVYDSGSWVLLIEGNVCKRVVALCVFESECEWVCASVSTHTCVWGCVCVREITGGGVFLTSCRICRVYVGPGSLDGDFGRS